MRVHLFIITMIGFFFFPLNPARANTTSARKYALILGGGGEPPGRTTVFDDSLKMLGGKLSDAGYQATVLFDGGHTTSEAVAKAIDPKAQPFFTDNVETELHQMIGKIDRDMRPGDQLMVVVDTHGGEPKGHDDGVDPEQAPPHDVEMADFGKFNMEQLAVIKKHARAKGVRLAILDMTCYSGTSLKLADKNTCVISATSADTVGLAAFSGQLFESLHKGHNLEDSFLVTRSQFPYGKPEISTPANLAAKSVLRNMESLIQFSPDDIFPSDDNLGEQKNQCDGDANTIDVQTRRLLKAISASLELDTNDRSELKKRLVDYLKLRQKSLNNNEFLAQTVDHVGDEPVAYVFMVNLDRNLAGMRDALKTEDDPDEKVYLQKFITAAPRLRRLRADLLKSDPEFAQIVSERQIQTGTNVTKEEYKLVRAAGRVSEYERMIYAKLYAAEAHRQTAQGKSNPCKDFKF